MDYKEKYKQALENIKKIKAANKDNKELVDFIEYQYPELKENKDEKIKKALLNEFIHLQSNGYKFAGLEGEEIIAWLEKQGESDETKAKKFLINKGYPINTNGTFPTYEKMYNIIREGLEKQGEQNLPDNVKSKFKVGDWVVQGKMLYQIEKVTNLTDNHFQYWTTDGVWFGDGTEAHLWTIQDAKDGDVLANENMVLIFKRFEEPSYRQHIIAHIGLDTCGHIQITNDSWNLGLDGAYPATKEQRNLLFQKIKESGYLWDAEKKKLKKIEQKPAGWSEEDEDYYDAIIAKLEVTQDDVLLTDNQMNFLKSLKERVQPKQEWSEEDEEYLQNIVEWVYCFIDDEDCGDMTYDEHKEFYMKRINWLKSLKQRMKGE